MREEFEVVADLPHQLVGTPSNPGIEPVVRLWQDRR